MPIYLPVEMPSGGKVTTYYDETTGLKLKKITIAGTAELSNYQTVSGIKIPYTRKADMSGQSIEFKVK